MGDFTGIYIRVLGFLDSMRYNLCYFRIVLFFVDIW